MKKEFLLLTVFLVLSLILKSQDTKTNEAKPAEEKLNVKFGGFVKGEVIWDMRAGSTDNKRMGLFYFYPNNVSIDANGKDINAVHNFNQYAVATRGNALFTGTNAFGAKATGFVEADFTGSNEGSFNDFRLRHAYVKLNWVHTELLIGQSWHPFNMPECIPEVQSLNTGAPFHPFSRQLQTKFSQNIWKFKLVAAISSQADNMDIGPAGNSVDYLRNSGIPVMDLQLHFKFNSDNECGIGGNYKRIVPRLTTTANSSTPTVTKADEYLDCMASVAYLKFKTKPISIKIEAVLGQNLYEYSMLGGYGEDSINPKNDHRTYSPINQFSFWTDIKSNTKKVQFGVFAGYAKSLGSLKNISGTVWGRGVTNDLKGNNISYIYRISPRVIFISGKVSLTAECEYTVAAYGKPENMLYNIINVKEVNNVRLLLAAIYYF